MPSRSAPPSPMLAALGPPPTGQRWAFEVKWDGARAVAVIEDAAVRLFSRNGNDISGSYPEVVDSLASALAGRDAILDGEIVALEKGRPSFSRLQRRMHVQHPTTRLLREYPVTFYVFDLLAVDGESMTARPYLDRRNALDGLALSESHLQVPPYWTGVDGARMLTLAREHHLEGVVAKRIDSVYRPGRRATTWIKTPIRKETEGIVCGWVDGTGAARGGIGSLLLGAYDDERRLVFIGAVGSGFTMAIRKALREYLVTIERPTSPFAAPPPDLDIRGAHWVNATLVVDAEYREYAGGRLRHPSWKRLRDDKAARDVDLPGRH
ncbi:ATP-dependent DNA ligase [Rhodococcus hoagii]|nr:ATP-dependent DNA ligase [Prescottella equi]NKS72207.1 ATP-dependent DNA ligase [Prescottella equi]